MFVFPSSKGEFINYRFVVSFMWQVGNNRPSSRCPCCIPYQRYADAKYASPLVACHFSSFPRYTSSYRPVSHMRSQKLAPTTRIPDPMNIALRPASPFGSFPVLLPPRYQLPISVSSPLCVSIAAFGPTFETSLRNVPKYE